jgi:hypothetical protein
MVHESSGDGFNQFLHGGTSTNAIFINYGHEPEKGALTRKRVH